MFRQAQQQLRQAIRFVLYIFPDRHNKKHWILVFKPLQCMYLFIPHMAVILKQNMYTGCFFYSAWWKGAGRRKSYFTCPLNCELCLESLSKDSDLKKMWLINSESVLQVLTAVREWPLTCWTYRRNRSVLWELPSGESVSHHHCQGTPDRSDESMTQSFILCFLTQSCFAVFQLPQNDCID